MLQSFDPIGLLYTGLFGVSGLVCLLAIFRARRFDDPDVRRGLVWLLATAGGWALFKTVFFLASDPFREPAYIVGLGIGFATVWAWLYFCSAYTGRNYHRISSLRQVSAAIFLSVLSVKVTNRYHHLYFTTEEATEPFSYLAIEHGALHWTATGLSYVLAAIGLFMIFQLFVESEYDTRPLSLLTGLIGVPVVVDMVAQFSPRIINVIYAPLGVAAFAIGVLFVFERRFLAVQRSVAGDDLSVYLDERDRIQDYSPAALDRFPSLEDATGDRLSDAVPAVADALESDDQILEYDAGDEDRYYFVSTTTVSLGEAGVRLLQLSDVTETERQRRELVERERELDEQNELYRAVIDASFASVFQIDPEGNYSFVSPSVEEFLGYTPDELRGQSFTHTLPDEETVERAWEQIEPILNGESNRAQEFPLETKSGTTVYADVRGVPIYEGSVPEDERTPADIVGIQLMIQDATDRRQRQGLISVINRVLRHNLRNKMTVITGYADMLRSRLDGESAEQADHIKRTADRLLDLAESAQRIEENRDPSPEREPMDVRPVVTGAVAQARDRHPEASVTVDGPEEAVATTHERLETAVWEVVDNAVRHGGDPPDVDVEIRATDRQVTVAVSDDGPGLPEVEQEVLESSTETQLVHGEGLGLWLVYWIVTSLNGEVHADPSPDGTTVTIRLPRPS